MQDSRTLRGFRVPAAVAYSATTFANHVQSSIFKFYYVKVFLVKYKIDDNWFYIAQLIFMIWNAINDPLFGYVQDNSSLSVFRVRRKTILYGAPIFALSFVSFWFPWATEGSWVVGAQLVVCLCVYDAVYTFVILAQCALFTEMSSDRKERVRLVAYDQVASILGAASVGVTEYVSSGLADFRLFQVSCVFFALLAFAGFAFTGYFAESQVAQLSRADAVDVEFEPLSSSVLRQTLEILRQRNFQSFVVSNFLQISHMTFFSNFASIFLDVLFPVDYLSPFHRSLFNGALFVSPQFIVLFVRPWLASKGASWVVIRSFFFKVIFSLLFYVGCFFHGVTNVETLVVLVLPYVLVDSAMSHAAFATFNLLISDIVDDDLRINRRRAPLSSSVFGTNALLTKPAVSLAPLLVLKLLKPFGFEAYKGDPDGFYKNSNDLMLLRSAVLNLLWCWPLLIGTLQTLAFSLYRPRICIQNKDQ